MKRTHISTIAMLPPLVIAAPVESQATLEERAAVAVAPQYQVLPNVVYSVTG